MTAHEQQEEKERFEALLIKTHDLTLQAENQKRQKKQFQNIHYESGGNRDGKSYSNSQSKGGVAKSTSCVNLGIGLVKKDIKFWQ